MDMRPFFCLPATLQAHAGVPQPRKPQTAKGATGPLPSAALLLRLPRALPAVVWSGRRWTSH